MKIISNGRFLSESLLKCKIAENVPSLSVLPETALILKNLPFFYPEFTTDIVALIQVGAKINKVGKHIQLKFAATYYEEIAIFIHFIAVDVLRNLNENSNSLLPALGFDYSIFPGNYMRKENIDETLVVELINNQHFQILTFIGWREKLDSLISESSKYFTLKNGDVILTGEGSLFENININSHLQLKVNQVEYLNCKVK